MKFLPLDKIHSGKVIFIARYCGYWNLWV